MATINSRRAAETLVDVAMVGRKVRIVWTSFTAELTINEADILVDKVVDALEGAKAAEGAGAKK